MKRKIKDWVIRKLGGYTNLPTPRIEYIKAPLPKPVKVAAQVDILPRIDGKYEADESDMRYLASQIGFALLEAGLIRFEVIHDLKGDVISKYQGSVMAIKTEPLMSLKGETYD